MTRMRLKGIHTVRWRRKDGTVGVYRYHRATGERLPGELGSPEFIAAFAKAEKLLTSRSSGALAALIRDYTGSVEFKNKLAGSTQAEYRRVLGKVESEFGNMPLDALDDPLVKREFLDWREKVAKASGEREADNRMAVTSAMLTWATDRGKITTNHLKGFRRLYHADRSDKIWLPEHIQAFMRVASPEMQRAMILAVHTGQRQGDLRRLAWTGYDGTALTLKQGKSGRGGKAPREVVVPCTRALRRLLDGMERVSPLIMTTRTGRAYQKRYFARQWEETAAKAGIEGLHFHDLRGTAVTLLSEAGATPQQIATITGHSLKTVTTILERYLARTRGLADQAILRFERSKRTAFARAMGANGEQDLESDCKVDRIGKVAGPKNL